MKPETIATQRTHSHSSQFSSTQAIRLEPACSLTSSYLALALSLSLEFIHTPRVRNEIALSCTAQPTNEFALGNSASPLHLTVFHPRTLPNAAAATATAAHICRRRRRHRRRQLFRSDGVFVQICTCFPRPFALVSCACERERDHIRSLRIRRQRSNASAHLVLGLPKVRTRKLKVNRAAVAWRSVRQQQRW